MESEEWGKVSGGTEMSNMFSRLMLFVGVAMMAAACQPPGYNQPAPGYGNPYYNSGYAPPPPPPPGYGYAQPAPNYNQTRYTTVTVTNRGQNGNRDDVVQQQVVCGSQYYDGYRNRTARC
jgi:hypothetical protein